MRNGWPNFDGMVPQMFAVLFKSYEQELAQRWARRRNRAEENFAIIDLAGVWGP